MQHYWLLLCAASIFTSCVHSQQQQPAHATLVDRCEGCEGIFEFGNKKLTPIDTLPTFKSGPIPMKIWGTIYLPDGKTPAQDVILYIYHTDTSGIYPKTGTETGWGKRHGYIRGWIKTGKDGQYTFYTQKPGVYPHRTDPAHIHPTVLEPNGRYYYLEDYYFEGDTLLTAKDLNPQAPRGGTSGVMRLERKGDVYESRRDFVLGKNVPGY